MGGGAVPAAGAGASPQDHLGDWVHQVAVVPFQLQSIHFHCTLFVLSAVGIQAAGRDATRAAVASTAAAAAAAAVALKPAEPLRVAAAVRRALSAHLDAWSPRAGGDRAGHVADR